MAQNSQEWQEETLHVDQTDLLIVKGGTGRPLLVLHDELGHPGWLKWHAALARNHTLIIPLHPGFGRTAAPEWIRSIRDLAGLYSILVRQQKLMPIDVIGFSLGGWIAAEMAAGNPDQFRRMILVGACGIRPTQGEIRDIFQMMAPDQLRTSVLDSREHAGVHQPRSAVSDPNSSSCGRMPGRRPRGWPGSPICIIPAWTTCWRRSRRRPC